MADTEWNPSALPADDAHANVSCDTIDDLTIPPGHPPIDGYLELCKSMKEEDDDEDEQDPQIPSIASSSEPDNISQNITVGETESSRLDHYFTISPSGVDSIVEDISVNSGQMSSKKLISLPMITSEEIGFSIPHFEAPQGTSTTQDLTVDFSRMESPVNRVITTAASGTGMIKDAVSNDFDLNITGVYFNSGAGNDLITGTGFNDFLRAGAGDDKIIAGAGDDVVRVGLGNDTVTLGNGDDIIFITADQLQGTSSNVIKDFNASGKDQIFIDKQLADYISIKGIGSASFNIILSGPKNLVGIGGITTFISEAGDINPADITLA